MAALSCFLSYQRDCARLRGIAAEIAPAKHTPTDRVIALLHWVYGNQSTKENRRFFVVPHMRATPCQVLETGGDCADKSRLLSAMLREVGISASMAMCFDPRSGDPTHTVVVASVAADATMVVDPAYDLYFPKPHPGQHYGLLDLRGDGSILLERLGQLRAELPRSHPIHSYNAECAAYSRASCINWERNGLTRIVRNWLDRDGTGAVHVIPRPLLMEEPKLLVGAFSLCAAAFAVAAFTTVGRLPRRRARMSRECVSRSAAGISGGVAVGAYPCGR